MFQKNNSYRKGCKDECMQNKVMQLLGVGGLQLIGPTGLQLGLKILTRIEAVEEDMLFVDVTMEVIIIELN